MLEDIPMKDAEPTISDVLVAITAFADETEKTFKGIKSDITGLQSDITGIKSDITGLQSDITGIKSDITTIKATMVTKDYLDRKLSDFRADVVGKVDAKDTALVHVLGKKKVISASESDEIVAMSPFPRLAA